MVRSSKILGLAVLASLGIGAGTMVDARDALAVAVTGSATPTPTPAVVIRTTAWASVTGAGSESGLVLFHEIPSTDPLGTRVLVTARVKGLSPGNHGIQIVAAGTCDATGYAALDFDPGASSASLLNHPNEAGDLPNLVDQNNGTWTMKFTTNRISLSSGSRSLFTSGAAILVRTSSDPAVSNDNGGAAIACGVINAGDPNVPPPASPIPSGL